MAVVDSSRLLHLAVAVVLSSCALLRADAAVHEYAGGRFAAVGNAFVLHGGSEGVYASAAAGAFIRFEKVAFRRTPESAAAAEADGNRTATVTAVIFEAGGRDAVGGSDGAGGQRALCCTPSMARRGDCTEGALVYRAANGSGAAWPRVLAASFPPGGGLEAAFPDETVALTRTGMYTLLFVHCDASLAAGGGGGGKTIWKNSRGYLPGRMAPLLPFYGGMSLAFAALAAYWFAQCARFWREVVPLQSGATLVIALGMVECATSYFDLAELDASGVRPGGAAFWAATSGVLRGAVSRVLVLLVAMGHGVVRPTLSGLTARVAALGAAYFAASEALDFGENVGAVGDDAPARRMFFLLPVAALNAVFVYWIFSSLSKTLNKLKARRMTAKLEMYRKLTNALIIAVAVSLGWITFEIHFKSTDEYNERWRAAWVIPAAWQLISFALLCAVCLLWAPSHGAAAYAYSEEAAAADGDDADGGGMDDARPLIFRPGPLSYVDSWAITVSQDATKIILRTDSGVYAKAGDGDKRV
ncbi:hypothetical protein ACP4OV_018688 [Aristida adscensionis]